MCHSLIVHDNQQGGPSLYQGTSPDEVALLDAARQLGFTFVRRSLTSIVLNMRGHTVTYDILNVMDFTSDRGRMSVIARAPDGRWLGCGWVVYGGCVGGGYVLYVVGVSTRHLPLPSPSPHPPLSQIPSDTIRLYCKGSDIRVLERLRSDTDPDLLADTNRNLHLFATRGLRTLLLGTRVLTAEEFADWDARYQEAAADLDNRDSRIAALAEEVEQELELVGATAIEDKLQVCVLGGGVGGGGSCVCVCVCVCVGRRCGLGLCVYV